MKQENIQKALEAIAKNGITVAGDLVLEKHVEYEVGNVEQGGIGIQINGKVAEAEKMFVSLQLQFFDMVMFGSEEKQPKLIAMLKDVAQQIDTTSGRGWFCIYAGYRYYKQQLAVMGGYADFFTDIETLVPDLLTKIDTTKEGEARYHNYTQLLGREANAWYMDRKKLPPLNEITIWKDRFNGDKNRYAANAQIIIDVYKRLKTI